MKNRDLENRLSNLSYALENIKSVSSTGIKRQDIREFMTMTGNLLNETGDHLFAVEDAVAAIEKLEELIEEKDERIEELEGMVAEWEKGVTARLFPRSMRMCTGNAN